MTNEQIRAAADYSRAQAGVACVIWQNGQVLLDEGQNGGSTSQHYELASGTKSFCGLIAAAAVADGFLSFDALVADTVTEWAGDPRKSRITVRMLLHLVSGLEPQGHLNTPTYAAAVAVPAVEEPGTRFVYDPVHFQAFGELMRRKLAARGGGTPVDYLKTRILDPIGAAVGHWRLGLDGLPLLPAGAQLAAREWVKVGELLRREGSWNGVQIIPADVLRELRTPGPIVPAYGLTFWLNYAIDAATLAANVVPAPLQNGGLYPEGPADLYAAAGAGDQRLYIVPHLNLVVVRQAPLLQAAAFSDEEFLRKLIPPSAPSQFSNLSTRGSAGLDEASLIAGIVVNGTRAKTLLIRAAGPALSAYGVSGAIADPQVRVFDQTGRLLFENDDWSSPSTRESSLQAAFATAGAFAFTSGSRDAALLVPLAPGAYTVQVTPARGTPGIALVEAYAVGE